MTDPQLFYNGHECQLTNISPAAEAEITQTLQYVNFSDMSNFIQRGGLTKDEAKTKATIKMYKDGRFLSGFLPRVRKILKAHNQKPEKILNYSAPEFHEYDLDELLEELELERATHQVDLLDTLQTKNRGQVVIPTGGGKSFSAAFLLAHFRTAKIIVTVPKVDLQVQIRETLEFVLKEPIGKIGGGGKDFVERVNVAVINTAVNRPELVKDMQVWIVDECHEKPEMQKRLSELMPQCAVRIGFTATPERKDRAHFEIEGVLGPVIYKTTRLELEEAGFILRPNIFNVKFVHDDTRQIQFSGARGGGQNGYVYYDRFGRPAKPDEHEHHEVCIINNVKRNKLITDLFTSFLEWPERTGPGAIFVGRIAHAELLAETFQQLGHKVYAVSSPKNKKEKERFKKIIQDARLGKIDGVIAADMLNTGTDIRPLQFALMAEPCSNKTINTQRIGRILRAPRNGEVKSGAHVVYIEDDEHWWFSHRASMAREFLAQEFPHSPIKDLSAGQFANKFR